METNDCRRSCKTKSFWSKTHQSWLRAKVVIAEFPRHYPDLRDYDLPPFAGSAGAGRSALGHNWHRLCARHSCSLATHPCPGEPGPPGCCAADTVLGLLARDGWDAGDRLPGAGCAGRGPLRATAAGSAHPGKLQGGGCSFPPRSWTKQQD